jgi:insecticidal toxin complex protein TccC
LQRWPNPDPAGTVDGLNLYVFATNNPSSGYDFQGLKYRGKEDRYEKRALNDVGNLTIGYRGKTQALKEGDLNFSWANDVALALSVELIKATIEELDTGHLDNFEIFLRGNNTPGTHDVPLIVSAKKSSNAYKSILKELYRYQKGGDLRDQIVYLRGESNPEGVNAFTYQADPNRRVYVLDRFMKEDIVGRSRTFIHELSHLAAGTEDHFYYPLRFPNITEEKSLSQLKNIPVFVRYEHRTQRRSGNINLEYHQITNADTLAVYPLLKLTEARTKEALQKAASPIEKQTFFGNIRKFIRGKS